MMALVWNIMNNLGEIAVYLPLKGATIPYFVERFVEPSLAFAAGWNYWYAYAILVAGTSFSFKLTVFQLTYTPKSLGPQFETPMSSQNPLLLYFLDS